MKCRECLSKLVFKTNLELVGLEEKDEVSTRTYLCINKDCKLKDQIVFFEFFHKELEPIQDTEPEIMLDVAMNEILV